jgi:hypothetical protein
MTPAFTLHVPAAQPFRALAPEIAAKCVELAGGSAADGKAMAARITDALGKLVDGDPHSDVELAFAAASGGSIEVTLRCNGRSAVVRS